MYQLIEEQYHPLKSLDPIYNKKQYEFFTLIKVEDKSVIPVIFYG